jgi:hypothetical protein
LSVPDKTTRIPITAVDGTEQRKQLLIETKLLTLTLPTRRFYYETEDLPPPISISINNDYQGCTDVTLRIHLCIEGYSDPAKQTITVAAGKQQTISLVPLLKPDMVATLKKIEPATLHIQAFNGNEPIFEDTKIIKLHACNTALLAVKAPDGKPVDLTRCLAAWVTPYNDKIEALLNQAAIPPYKSDGAFVGYPQGQSSQKGIDIVRKQAQAIFEILRHGIKLKYIESSNNFGTENEQIAQRVRLPYEVLASGGSANCLDGAVLFASLLELASINPVILLLPDHAVVGWYTHPDKQHYEFVDTTLIPREDFTTALRKGQKYYRKALTQKLFNKEIFDFTGFARLIDIKLCRGHGIYDN